MTHSSVVFVGRAVKTEYDRTGLPLHLIRGGTRSGCGGGGHGGEGSTEYADPVSHLNGTGRPKAHPGAPVLREIIELKYGMGATRRQAPGEGRGKRSLLRQPFSVLEWPRSNLKHKRANGGNGEMQQCAHGRWSRTGKKDKAVKLRNSNCSASIAKHSSSRRTAAKNALC